MANAEAIFSSSTLGLLVPDVVLELPKVEGGLNVDDWLKSTEDAGQRQKVFFDERLDFFLTLRLQDPTSDASVALTKPPPLLLSFLNHLQVTLDATYISSRPQELSPNGRIPIPPIRTSSAGLGAKPKTLGLPSQHIPPQTPSPMPVTNETDRKYAYSEGTLLKSSAWGDDSSDEVDTFRLLWSENEQSWIALYKLSVVVAFVRTNINDPLLCLTSSITLRDKPLPASPQRQRLTDLIEAAGKIPSLNEEAPEEVPSSGENSPTFGAGVESCLEEVNLLDGLEILSLDDAQPQKMFLPTARFGSSIRQAYALPPVSPTSPQLKTPTSAHSLPVLRKSYRKVLPTVSGFFVRMRTVFIPQLYIPGDTDSEQQATSEESTVVLCVEIENSGDSGAGFSIDSVNVVISGEGAKIKLIGWGEGCLSDSSKVFPLLMRPAEQYNLLYAVSFLRPAETLLAPDRSPESAAEFQRAVSINIIGRPFSSDQPDISLKDSLESLTHPTSPFLSRWNCVLDLTPRRDRDSLQMLEDTSIGSRNALPYPSSPFPVPNPNTQLAQEQAASVTQQPAPIAGSKRHTLPVISSTTRHDSRLFAPQRPASLGPGPYKSNSPARLQPPGDRSSRRGSPVSPAAVSPPLPPLPLGAPGAPAPGTPGIAQNQGVPPTPAFPSYSTGPPTPRPSSITPSFGQMGSVGLGIDARREKVTQPGIPQTPAPRLMAGERVPTGIRTGSAEFVVSVSLVRPHSGAITLEDHAHIYPLDEFSLEIFVFNQSPYLRTLEATCPDHRRRREEKQSLYSASSIEHWKPSPPAFVPLEGKIRIGPLSPSTCQSVTMRFLALRPGIHTIDSLLLIDVDTGDSVNLRSVMDFAVLSREQAS